MAESSRSPPKVILSPLLVSEFVYICRIEKPKGSLFAAFVKVRQDMKIVGVALCLFPKWELTVLDAGSGRGTVPEYIAQDWRLTFFCKIFGPVLSIITFETEAEAVELANSTVYGLGAAVFSSDANQCMRLTSAIDSGTVRRWVVTR